MINNNEFISYIIVIFSYRIFILFILFISKREFFLLNNRTYFRLIIVHKTIIVDEYLYNDIFISLEYKNIMIYNSKYVISL